MNFKKFEDLWNYSEGIAAKDSISTDKAAENISESLKKKMYGELLYNLSIISKNENINIFVELQRAVEDHFIAQQEDD
jgi:hypothetical protein